MNNNNNILDYKQNITTVDNNSIKNTINDNLSVKQSTRAGTVVNKTIKNSTGTGGKNIFQANVSSTSNETHPTKEKPNINNCNPIMYNALNTLLNRLIIEKISDGKFISNIANQLVNEIMNNDCMLKFFKEILKNHLEKTTIKNIPKSVEEKQNTHVPVIKNACPHKNLPHYAKVFI
jgi:hypothetical protein